MSIHVKPEGLYDILAGYVGSHGLELNIDRDFVMDLIAGLLKNEDRYGYRSCPCRLAAGSRDKDNDIICPCIYRAADVKEYGSCYCGLYVSADWNEGKVSHQIVPERRIKKG